MRGNEKAAASFQSFRSFWFAAVLYLPIPHPSQEVSLSCGPSSLTADLTFDLHLPCSNRCNHRPESIRSQWTTSTPCPPSKPSAYASAPSTTSWPASSIHIEWPLIWLSITDAQDMHCCSVRQGRVAALEIHAGVPTGLSRVQQPIMPLGRYRELSSLACHVRYLEASTSLPSGMADAHEYRCLLLRALISLCHCVGLPGCLLSRAAPQKWLPFNFGTWVCDAAHCMKQSSVSSLSTLMTRACFDVSLLCLNLVVECSDTGVAASLPQPNRLSEKARKQRTVH
eukprot:1157289-Pelagomonas_calceolata.AAC.11